MFNKKRLVALTLSSAMIAGALAGCSNSSSNTTTTAAATTAATTEAAKGDATTEAAKGDETTAETTVADTTVAPSYAVEAGKVVDFEDGNYDFILMNVQSPVDDDSTLSIVDFNGSKALKIEPKSNAAGTLETIGIDVTSLLGAKVADAASVSFQLAVESTDGKFHAVTGTVYQKHTDASGSSWAVYSKSKNPNEITVKFNGSYDAAEKNVLTIKKDSSSGNNMDTAWPATGSFSTMYLDNIVFFDASGNPIDVDTTVAFDAPDGFGSLDWSNLIEVTDQVIIPGFSASANGWAQGPANSDGSWTIMNKCTVETPVVDENGDPVLDENGEQKVETTESGSVDLASIMKPGTVFTIYYSNEEQGNWNEQIWFVLAYNDYNLGWNRLLSHEIPQEAKDAGLTFESSPEEKKGYVFAINNSKNMAQVTYDEIINYIDMKYASKLPEGTTAKDIDWSGSWGLQCESGSAWSVTAVTYALDQY